MDNIEAGVEAPDFTAPSTDGGQVTLSGYCNFNVLLYFYPRDNTPGCTQEGLDFTRYCKKFKQKDTVIFGVSRDSLITHKKFKDQQGYTFPLLSDPEGIICNLYSVMKSKNMYGKQVRGIERSTFLIDKRRQIVRVWRKVKILGHAAEVWAEIQKL